MLISNCEVIFKPKDPANGLIFYEADVVIKDEDLSFITGQEKAITATILVRPVESKRVFGAYGDLTLSQISKHRQDCMTAINNAIAEFQRKTGKPAQVSIKRVDDQCIADVNVII